jgi:hypothetical protein
MHIARARTRSSKDRCMVPLAPAKLNVFHEDKIHQTEESGQSGLGSSLADGRTDSDLAHPVSVARMHLMLENDIDQKQKGKP